MNKPADYHLEDILKPETLEDRIYRLRCVERWSMVIPWVGFPLANLLKRVEPKSTAKFVEFTTLLNQQQMPGTRREVLDWPYTEGLRLDEAMHPLTILAVGLYGEYLPNQNGAPIRLVVPWKYGFKSIKSIVRIRLTDRQPMNSWQLSAPDEYGFYSNVNPERDHPRWSQARERRIGEFFMRPTRDLQRLRRSGGVVVHRDGSQEILLKPARLCSRARSVCASCCGAASTATSRPILSPRSPTRPASGRCVSSSSRSPSRQCGGVSGWNPVIRFRRMLGLFAFFYGIAAFSHLSW